MASRLGVVVLSAGLGLVAGLALAAAIRDEPVDTESAAPAEISQVGSAASSELASLREALAIERDARIALAEELDLIWDEIANLRSAGTAKPTGPEKPGTATANKRSGRDSWFDEQALARAGLSSADARRLRERFEQAELDRLYLRDLATREGWVSTPRFRAEMQQTSAQLRIDLGEDDYDWVLYASGHDNRVLVDDVLHASPAADAGLHKGDIIVRYDGELMLSPQELRAATTRGRASETVAIDALRGGERLRVYVPRGPLGTRLGGTRRSPEQ